MGTRLWSERENDRLVDLIYDAAFDEALWPAVLERVGDRVGAHPGNITQLNFLDGGGIGLAARAPDDIMDRYFADWARHNPIALAENAASYTTGWMPRITRDGESIDRRRLEQSAFWNEFLVPIGACHLTILRLSLRDTDVTTITLGRPNHLGAFEDNEIDALRPLHPHLIRAERMARRLGPHRDATDQIGALLAASPDALFFLDDSFRLLRRTAAADQMLRDGTALRRAGGRLQAVQGPADAALQHALRTALGHGVPPPVTLPTSGSGAALSVSVALLGERSRAGFAGRSLMVAARPLAAVDPVGGLQRAFGLTAAEARLALTLAAGDSLRTIAGRRGVSINTVRNQLSAVFDKTDCRRQQDLVRLLAGAPQAAVLVEP